MDSLKKWRRIGFLVLTLFSISSLTAKGIEARPRDMGGGEGISVRTSGLGQCLQTPRWWALTQSLSPGKLIFAGGHHHQRGLEGKKEGLIPTDSIEIVDLQTCRSRRLRTHMTVPRRGNNSSETLSPGQVLFFGNSPDLKTNIDLFDAHRQTIKGVGNLTEPRAAPGHVVLHDGPDKGKVLICGGYDRTWKQTDTAELFDPASGTSIHLPSMHQQRASHSVTPIGDGLYLIVGGLGESANTAEIYNSNTRTFISIKHPHFGRKDHQAVKTEDGKVWLIGGTDQAGKAVAHIEYFEFDADTGEAKFVQTKSVLSEARDDLAAVYLSEFNLIVAVGGEKTGNARGGENYLPSDAIDVIDVSDHSVTSARLFYGPRDEPILSRLSVDRSARQATLVVLTGQGIDYKPMPAEKLTITISASGTPRSSSAVR